MPNVTGKSLPVSTRCTPGCFSALEKSILSINACGCGLRKSFVCSMRGSTMSSAKRVWPVTLARPSTRRRGLPRTFMHSLRGFFDRLEDLLVAGAAAEVARDRFLDAFSGRSGFLFEQRLGRHQYPRGAVAALRGPEVGKGGLQRMELCPHGQALDRLDAFPRAFQSEDQAGELRLAIDQHCAGAALAELAAVLGPGKA